MQRTDIFAPFQHFESKIQYDLSGESYCANCTFGDSIKELLTAASH